MTKVQSFLRISNNRWRVGLVALAIMTSLVAGASPLVDESPVSPLIIAGAVAALVISIALLQSPVWALYVAIFVVSLPSVRGPTPLAQFIDRMQSFLNRSVTLIALVSWLLDAITRRRRIVWTSTALLMLGFLAWGTVTLAWVPDLGRGMEKVGQYAFRLILYLLLIANEINTKETLDGLMRTLAINGWVLVLAGVGMVLSQGYEPGTRLKVLGMDENEFGIRVLVTMPGVLWQVMQASRREKTLRMVLSVVFVSLALVLVSLSGSRGSAVSWLATLLAFWLWKPTRPWGKVGLLILAVAVISAPLIFSTVVHRLLAAESGLLGGRLTIWQASWLIVRDHPWGGVGIGNAGAALSSYVGRITSHWAYRETASHNAILQIWIETGTPGVLLYLSVLVSAVWLFVRQYSQYSRTGARSIKFCFALVSCVFVGVMLWWIKGGGAAYDLSYFLLLAFLVIPSRLEIEGSDRITESDIQDAGRGKRWTRDLVPRSRSPS